MADFMLGKNKSEESVRILDDILLETIKNGVKTKVNLLLSENDVCYDTDFVPLLDKFQKEEIEYAMVNEKRMTCHNDIQYFFSDYFKTYLLQLLMGKKVYMPEVKEKKGKVVVKHRRHDIHWRYLMEGVPEDFMKVKSGRNYLLYDYSKIKNEAFMFNLTAECLMAYKGEHRAIFKENVYGGIIPRSVLEILGYEYKMDNENLYFKVKVATSLNLKYAFYLFEENEKKEVIWYSDKEECVFGIEKDKVYQVTYFIKLPNGEKISKKSEKIRIG